MTNDFDSNGIKLERKTTYQNVTKNDVTRKDGPQAWDISFLHLLTAIEKKSLNLKALISCKDLPQLHKLQALSFK